MDAPHMIEALVRREALRREREGARDRARETVTGARNSEAGSALDKRDSEAMEALWMRETARRSLTVSPSRVQTDMTQPSHTDKETDLEDTPTSEALAGSIGYVEVCHLPQEPLRLRLLPPLCTYDQCLSCFEPIFDLT